MNTHRIYQIGLFVMLAMNIILLFLMFRGPKFPPRPLGKEDMMKRISQQLALTSDQEQRYFKMAQGHQMAMMDIEREQRSLLKAYFSNLREASSDSLTQATRMTQLSALEEKKITLTYQHFEALKALCTPAQLTHFDDITEKITQVLTGAEKNAPPPPRDF
ncbi:MAG: hypothetical protein ACMVP2_17565 [Imperialibacter sp.]|uniref:hypothetical protein n=1 Tax=Imperialibacter sp. TaxID=2038411 RepID=UPI0030DDA129|tara:strand:+ start:6206 stop:6688 length:483 start_codon:yes stop_codon:yes gene_type:complete